MIASSGVETEIRALGTRFVAIFRFREICDVDYNLSSKITSSHILFILRVFWAPWGPE